MAEASERLSALTVRYDRHSIESGRAVQPSPSVPPMGYRRASLAWASHLARVQQPLSPVVV